MFKGFFQDSGMIPVRPDTHSIQFFPFTREVLGRETTSTPQFTPAPGSMGAIRVVNQLMAPDSNPQVRLARLAT